MTPISRCATVFFSEPHGNVFDTHPAVPWTWQLERSPKLAGFGFGCSKWWMFQSWSWFPIKSSKNHHLSSSMFILDLAFSPLGCWIYVYPHHLRSKKVTRLRTIFAAIRPNPGCRRASWTSDRQSPPPARLMVDHGLRNSWEYFEETEICSGNL